MAHCQDLPGQELFQYLAADGSRRTIDSGDVNAYLREITGEDFTAKDFRTWAVTVLAAKALAEAPGFTSQTQARRHVVRAIERVARDLGNTPTISRKCYIHPVVVESYLEGGLSDALAAAAQVRTRRGTAPALRPDERAVLALVSAKERMRGIAA